MQLMNITKLLHEYSLSFLSFLLKVLKIVANVSYACKCDIKISLQIFRFTKCLTNLAIFFSLEMRICQIEKNVSLRERVKRG